jgi:hypothetical protein
MPVGAGEAPAQGGEDQGLARAPGNPLGAAPQDPNSVAQGEKVEVSDCAAPAPDRGEVQEQMDGGVEER